MKRMVSTLLMISMCGLMPLMPNRAMAAAVPTVVATTTETEAGELKPCPAGTFRVRRNTRTKKKIVNALIAGGVGAAIGGGLGGGRGALLGAGAGSGGYLVYRYVRDRRGRCVPRYVRG